MNRHSGKETDLPGLSADRQAAGKAAQSRPAEGQRSVDGRVTYEWGRRESPRGGRDFWQEAGLVWAPGLQSGRAPGPCRPGAPPGIIRSISEHAMKHRTALPWQDILAGLTAVVLLIGAHAAENYLAIVGPVTVDTRRPDLTVAALDTPLEALAASAQPVAWTVLNQGAAPVLANWVDRVYLSTDATVGSDRLVGEYPAVGPLATNQSLPRAQNITLPEDLEPDRDYWWIVITDADNALDESNEANNARVSDQPMRLVRSPRPNLRVTSVSASANPMSGQPVTVSWTVTNAGTWTTGAGLWQDAVYLADRPELDTATVLLDRVQRPRPLGTNESYASSLTAPLPQGVSGTRYFIVQTDADNRVNEGSGENDNLTTGAPVVIGLTPPPDLQVTRVEAPSTAVSGASLAVRWTVTNAGPGPTVAFDWSDDLYLSPTPALSTNALLLGSMPHTGALTNGAAYTASAAFVVPPSVSGFFYLLVYTDTGDQVFEHVFETNNVAASPTPIVITLTPPPDLAVTAVTAPATALASHPLTISAVITNQGTDTLFQFFWEDRLYLSGDAVLDGLDVVLASEWHWGGLLAGERYTNTFTASLPHGLSGAWRVLVQTDAASAVFELDKTNNVRASASPIQVDSRPADLIVTSLTAPASAQAGSSVLVSWTVKNQGSGDTAANRWNDRLVLSTGATPGNADDVTLLVLDHDGLLPTGGSYTVTNHVGTIPFTVAPGTWRLFAMTDVDNAVYEGADDGNNASLPRTISVSRQVADLRVASVSLAPLGGETSEGPLALFSEDTLLVSWRVENAGAAPPNSSVWADAVYLSTNAIWSTNSILLGVNQNPATLDPGASYTNTVAVTLPAEIQGEYCVHVFSDAADQVIEDNKANNVVAATNTVEVTLRPVPDLAVVAVQTPADGFSGQLFELSWTVTNRGPASAEGTWFDSVYLSLDTQFEPELDTYIGYAERPHTLTNGQCYTQTATLRVPPDVSGLLYVFAVCDSTERVNERGARANNVGRAPTPVSVWIRPPADLVIGTIAIPANAMAGYEMALTYVLHNQGTNAAFGPWVDALYLSADDQWDIGDALFTRVSQSGFLAVGDSRTNTVSAPAPGVLPGNYRVIIRTDVVNQVPETNELNNITATLDQVASQVDALELGVPTTNSLAHHQARYYRVHVTAGQWLVLELGCATATAATELYASFEAIPSRSEFEYRHSNPLQPNQRIVVPNTREGDYYILVYGDFIPAPGSAGITLLARLSQFLVFDTDFGRGGNAGNLTIPINGVDLDRTCTVLLTNGRAGIPAGLARPAIAHYYDTSTRFWATLDLRDLAPGLYTVAVQNGDGSTVTIPDSLEVVASGPPPPVIPVVNAPSAMRMFVAYSFTVQWANTGLNDSPAPLLTVGNTVPFGLRPGDYSLGTRYTFLGINTQDGPPGILRPGQAETMTFHSFSGTDAGTYTAFADRVGKLSAATMDWQRVGASLPNAQLGRDNFDAVFEEMTGQIGPTWGDYLTVLSRNVTLLPLSTPDRRHPGTLERLAWRNALASFAGSLSGVVIEEGLRLNYTAATLYATHTETQAITPTALLSDGSFLFDGLDSGTYELHMSPAFVLDPASVVLEDGVSVHGLRLKASAGGSLTGVVRDVDNGQPIQAAFVDLVTTNQPPLHTRTVQSDSAGTYRFDGLLEGAYAIRVRHPNYSDAHTDYVVVRLDTTSVVDARLSQTGWIDFSITDLVSGLEVTNMFITVARTGTNTLVYAGHSTDSHSHPITQLVPGRYDLHVSSDGYFPEVVSNIVVSPSSGTSIHIALQRPASISGMVVDPLDRPVGKARIDLLNASGDLVASNTTCADGTYRFTFLRSGEYRTRCSLGAFTRVNPVLSLNEGQRVVVSDIRITGLAVVRGAVVGSQRARHPGAGIAVHNTSGHLLASTIADSNGEFLAILHRAGRFWLTASTPTTVTVPQCIEVVPDEATNLWVELQTGIRTACGRVVRPDGLASTGAVVIAELCNPAVPYELGLSTRTGADGGFVFGGLPEGDYRVQAMCNGFSMAGISLSLTSSNASNILIRLAPGRCLSGSVVSNATPVADADVFVFSALTNLFLGSALCDSNGQYQVCALPAALCDVIVETPGLGSAVINGVDVRSQDMACHVDIQGPIGSVMGIVASADNGWMPPPSVWLEDECGRSMLAGVADDTGGWTISGLLPTRGRVVAYQPGFEIPRSSLLVISNSSSLTVDPLTASRVVTLFAPRSGTQVSPSLRQSDFTWRTVDARSLLQGKYWWQNWNLNFTRPDEPAEPTFPECRDFEAEFMAAHAAWRRMWERRQRALDYQKMFQNEVIDTVGDLGKDLVDWMAEFGDELFSHFRRLRLVGRLLDCYESINDVISGGFGSADVAWDRLLANDYEQVDQLGEAVTHQESNVEAYLDSLVNFGDRDVVSAADAILEAAADIKNTLERQKWGFTLEELRERFGQLPQNRRELLHALRREGRQRLDNLLNAATKLAGALDQGQALWRAVKDSGSADARIAPYWMMFHHALEDYDAAVDQAKRVVEEYRVAAQLPTSYQVRGDYWVAQKNTSFSPGGRGVLANDYGVECGSLFVSSFRAIAGGSLAYWDREGNFLFVPEEGFTGTAVLTYTASVRDFGLRGEEREFFVGIADVRVLFLEDDPCELPDPPSDCDPCDSSNPPDSCDDTDRPPSCDPNDIVGPGGFGPEYWISPDQTFHYTVRFENDAEKALAPAQYVCVTHPLSTNLDLRTFRLGVMGFGTNLVEVPLDRTFYQTRLDLLDTLGVVLDIHANLDLEKGEVTWEFFSLDPETGDFPFNPFLGFLPPNTDGIIGQGFVTYTIRPKPGIAQGDIINAEARIFFDYNEPIDTPRIFNTVDTGQPTSTVLPLPASTNRNVFTVQWAGADSYGGAGIGGFDIYVSEDGGPWRLWLANTAYWEQLFVGECGHTYAFYSVARDNVGHIEAAVPALQAHISVLPNQPPVLEAVANRVLAVGQVLVITNVVHEADAGQAVTFSLDSGAPLGMDIDPHSGVLTWRPTCVQGRQTYAVTVVATDDGCGQLEAARTFAITVTDCLEARLGRAVVAAGEVGCVPLFLESSDGLTNLTVVIDVPEGRFTEFSVHATAPEVGSAHVEVLSPTEVRVSLAAQPGQVLRGPKQCADVCFRLAIEQSSAFVALEIEDILGMRADGVPVGSTEGSAGRVAAVGQEPLLEMRQDISGKPVLILYCQPGVRCQIETVRGMEFPLGWQPWQTVTPTTLDTAIPVEPSDEERYYRARR